MKISVIIPTYKPKEYIWQCLDSLCQQTFNHKDFETLVILNGCCEPWKSQISDYIAKHQDTNFRLLQTDEGGVSNARNIGLDNAKGEYITFVDDDDYVSPKYLEAMYKETDGKSVILTDSFAFNDDCPAQIIETYAPHQSYLKFGNTNNCSLFHARAIFNGPCMKLLLRSFIHGERFDTSLFIGEDSMFMFAISKNIKHIKFASEESLYYRRYRNNSAITKERTRWFWAKNCIKMQYITFRYWIKSPFKYNLKFTISRLLAPLKAVLK